MFEVWTECEMPLMAIVLPVGTRFYVKQDLRVYVSDEYYLSGQWRHAAIWTRERYPSWEEIKDARYRFFGEEEEVFQILPPKSEYVNFYEYAFHLWLKVGVRLMPLVGMNDVGDNVPNICGTFPAPRWGTWRDSHHLGGAGAEPSASVREGVNNGEA